MGSYDESLFVNREKALRGFDRLLKPEMKKAVMVVTAETLMGKTWLIGKMREQCQDREKIPVAAVDFRSPRVREEIGDAVGLVRLVRNKLGHPECFNHLNDVINDYTEPETDTKPGTGGRIRALYALAVKIEQYFDLDSLQRFCQFIGVKWENLGGDTLYRKAYGLAAHFQCRGTLDDLVRKLEEERPNVDWRKDLGPLLGERSDGPIITDRGRPLRADSAEGRSLAVRRINDAFFTCLKEMAEEVQPVVFLFDGCEEMPDEAKRWIRVQLLDRLHTQKLEGVVSIFAGRTIPDLPFPPNLTVETGLVAFDEERARALFDRLGYPVEDQSILSVLVTLSDGEPGKLAKWADKLRARDEQDDPFFAE